MVCVLDKHKLSEKTTFIVVQFGVVLGLKTNMQISKMFCRCFSLTGASNLLSKVWEVVVSRCNKQIIYGKFIRDCKKSKCTVPTNISAHVNRACA